MTNQTASPPPPRRLSRPHPLVAATKTVAVGHKPDETGRLVLGARGGAVVKVSRASLPRALRLLDAIFKGAEAQGWKVVAGEKYSGKSMTQIVNADHKVAITITEDTTKTRHIPTKAEQVQIDKGYRYGIPEYDHEPNGRLSIRLVECYVAKRSNWNDGVRQRVEDMLGDVVAGIAQAFESYEARDAERLRKEQEDRERKTAALERAYQDLVAKIRVEMVMEQARTWRLAQDLRDYREIVRQRAEALGPLKPEVAGWLAWVEWHLDQELDPPGQLPTMPPTPGRSDERVREHLVANAGRWSDVYLEWSRS